VVTRLARHRLWLLLVGVIALAGCGDDGGDESAGGETTAADTQTISFQEPEDPGDDPFTPPADVEGSTEVEAQQPFGGSGSNRVCDRDRLIEFLGENPDRLAEWARVLDIEPDIEAVRKYIAKLHPVTLTRDTQVTNHAFKDGRAVPFQAILQAGTAVLVDEYGVPVVRCFCGNPLLPAVVTPQAQCSGCPADYEPPPQCEYSRRESYDESYYRRDYYSNGDYDEIYITRHRQSPYAKCYEPYPDPPVVTAVNVYRAPPEPEPEPPPPAPEPEPTPQPEPEPDTLQCDPPRSQLESEQCAALEQPAPEPEPQPAPDPNYDCPDQPPAHPGEDYLRNCPG
jgi:hypothetical protein